MSVIPFKGKNPAPDIQHKDDPLASKLETMSSHTQDLVQRLRSLGLRNIRVYTNEDIKKVNPADLSPSTRRLLIREQNEKHNEE